MRLSPVGFLEATRSIARLFPIIFYNDKLLAANYDSAKVAITNWTLANVTVGYWELPHWSSLPEQVSLCSPFRLVTVQSPPIVPV